MENIVEKSVLGLTGMALTINAVISAIPVSQGASKETVLAAYNAGSAGEKIAFSTPAHANVPLALANGALGAVAVWTALKGVSLKPSPKELESQPKPKVQAKPKPEVNFNLEEPEVEVDQPEIEFEEPEVEVDQPEITPPQQQPKEWDLARATARLKLQMPRTNVFDWETIYGQAQGFIISGDPGSGKSCLASWLLGWLTQKERSVIFVIDHHGSQSWKLSGIEMSEVVSDISQIYQLIDALGAEMESRQKLYKAGSSVGPNIIVVIDEFTALSMKLKTKKIDPKPLQDLIRSLLIEGRKFGMTVIFLAHNTNCSELGVSANERNSFGLIKLGLYARQALAEIGIRSDEIGYPCFVGGALQPAIAVHPTHGWAKQFVLNGVAPKGILPIKRAELDPDSMLGMISELLRDDS
jgi:hypothetical protein